LLVSKDKTQADIIVVQLGMGHQKFVQILGVIAIKLAGILITILARIYDLQLILTKK